MPKVVIIGAGPTGIGAAMRLIELGQRDYLVIDSAEAPGGLAASHVDDQGFTWDLGGHVQFSHYEIFDEYMELALGSDGWFHHQRESWVWMRERFIPYPFQYNLQRLPPAEMWDCVRGLLAIRGTQEKPRHFREWIQATFGTGIAETFLLPYNFKVWAYPPEDMSAVWVGERVAVPDLSKVLEGICLNKDQVSWGPNATFRFPKYGGTGAIWRALGERIPAKSMKMNAAVTAIDGSSRTLQLASGETVDYEYLLSCIPLDCLTKLLNNPELSAASGRLKHSGTHIIGIGMEGSPPEELRTKCWMYFPEDNCPFYRVTVFSNYSQYNTPRPGATWSLMAEIATSECKPVDDAAVVEDTIRGMLNTRLIRPTDRIISRWRRFLHYGYPTPSIDRDDILSRCLPELERQGIYSRGRFGAWKYEVSNQDHSFMQGWECVDRILAVDVSESEPTLLSPNVVNATYQRRC